MTYYNVEEIQFWCRRDSAANWTSVNPILHSGEWGVETDNTGATPRKFKMGDGITAWTSLPYSNPAAFIVQTVTNGDTTHAPSGDAVFDAIAAAVAAIPPSFVPTLIAAGDTFTIPVNKQALSAVTIDVQGTLDVVGTFVVL